MLGITDTQNYTDIADAIRAKNGSADTYMPSEMAAAISALPSAGGGLPSAYQQVTYIGTSGTQFLSLGVNSKGSFITFADFEITARSSAWLVVWGAYMLNNQYVVVTTDSNNYVNVSYYTSTFSGKTLSYNQRTRMLMSPKYVAWEQGYQTYTQNNFTGSELKICSNGLSMKIYQFTVQDGNTPVLNLVPCYRIADGVIGMYDLVNNIFHTNAGTGTFTKGADV